MDRSALYAPQYLPKKKWLAECVLQRSKEKVNVVWHHDESMHLKLRAIVMQAVFEDEGADRGLEGKVGVGLEAHKDCFAWFLQVWKAATIGKLSWSRPQFFAAGGGRATKAGTFLVEGP